MQVSRETDLKQLKDLGFNMYDDINIAKRKLYESISTGDRKYADEVMYTLATSKDFYELKTLLRKHDYMQRCTNTNAKTSILTLLLFAEFQGMIAEPGKDPKGHFEGIVNHFTERKIYPGLGRVVIFKDILDVNSIIYEHFVSENFYQNLLDYLANIIFEFRL